MALLFESGYAFFAGPWEFWEIGVLEQKGNGRQCFYYVKDEVTQNTDNSHR